MNVVHPYIQGIVQKRARFKSGNHKPRSSKTQDIYSYPIQALEVEPQRVILCLHIRLIMELGTFAKSFKGWLLQHTSSCREIGTQLAQTDNICLLPLLCIACLHSLLWINKLEENEETRKPTSSRISTLGNDSTTLFLKL